jgi:hypothetical protein
LVLPFYHISRILHGFDLCLQDPSSLSARSEDLDIELVELGLHIGVSDDAYVFHPQVPDQITPLH